jgi:uncharacterized repeat protein (TIGR03803 family)
MRYFACALAVAVPFFAGTADAQTFTTLVQFTGTGGTANGWSPFGSLIVSDTTLYGMTSAGGIVNGSRGMGNIFSVGINGTNYQNLVSFTGTGGTASGNIPNGSLAISGSTLYGMTQYGGANLFGTVFSVGTDGTNFQNLVSFTGTGGTATGYLPLGSLTLVGSALYGMTQYGAGSGNIFSIGTSGTNYQNVVSFTNSLGGTATGYDPLGSLILGGSTLYGMTSFAGYGNVFGVGTDGTSYQHIVPYFTGSSGTASGEAPQGSLMLAGSTLYGMTENGGAFGKGNVFSVGTNATNFQNLVSFDGSGGTPNGADPYGSLILSGTTLYGMTDEGGAAIGAGFGEIFSIGIDGSDYQDLYSFTGGADGGNPHGDLTLSGGTLFGMTSAYGANGYGTVFALTLPTPEPGTLVLAGAGAAALVSYHLARRRRRRPCTGGEERRVRSGGRSNLVARSLNHH